MSVTYEICRWSKTLEDLIYYFGRYKIAIFDYTLYIDDSDTPMVLNSEADYKPYLAYRPFYIIEDATFDDITYHKVIRLMSPKT